MLSEPQSKFDSSYKKIVSEIDQIFGRTRKLREELKDWREASTFSLAIQFYPL